MNHWPFIIGAYVIAFAATAGLTWWSWASMRAAEADVDKLSRDREA